MFRGKVINSDLWILHILVLSWIKPNQGQNTSPWAWHCWTPDLVLFILLERVMPSHCALWQVSVHLYSSAANTGKVRQTLAKQSGATIASATSTHCLTLPSLTGAETSINFFFVFWKSFLRYRIWAVCHMITFLANHPVWFYIKHPSILKWIQSHQPTLVSILLYLHAVSVLWEPRRQE